METAYVEQRDGGYWIRGTRISLDSSVYEFNSGAAPELIRHSYPLLSLEEVYGAITFYLSHQHEIDDYVAASEPILDQQASELNARTLKANPELFDRFRKARREREATLDLIDS